MIFFEFNHALSLFYVAVAITALELVEEIILVIMLPEWKTNVKGLFWVLKSKRGAQPNNNRT
jgi:CDP-diacylglycerol--glycerol-3-phosphate 3-phosphatidyltransferase